jgi:glycosyltransferase involved in cell wall biosynthesis
MQMLMHRQLSAPYKYLSACCEDAVVAIPVRDEATRIGGCLAALSRQSIPASHVVLLLNNCTDGTADIVKELSQGPDRPHIGWHVDGASAIFR